jgi:glycosyltransferase involved in cell wall biosynthesis
MQNASQLRIAVWTPLPPQRTGIAANVVTVLPELAALAELTLVVDDRLVGVARAPSGLRQISRSAYAARRDDFDLCVYHMGNNFGFHEWMYEELLRTPGLVVLHDIDLRGFYLDAPSALRHGLPASSVAATEPDLGSCRLIVEASRAVLVHSDWAARELRRRHPTTPIVCGHLAAPRPDSRADPTAVRRACGWDSEHFVVGVLGAYAPHKRVELALRMFAAVRHTLPAARLLVAGWAYHPPTVTALERLVEELALDPVVQLVTDLESFELDGCVLAADLVLDLRAPAAGEIPATLLRAFAAARPAIVTDLPQLRALDAPFCHRVPSDSSEVIPATAQALIDRAADRTVTRLLGRRAQEWVEATSTPRRVAAEHRAALDVAGAAPSPTTPLVPVSVRGGSQLGVTVVGDITATTGLMEAGRRLLVALESAGVALDYFHHPCVGASHNPARDEASLASRLPSGRRYPTELWLANLNEFEGVPPALLRPPGGRHRVIASWFWELPTVQEPYASHVPRVDEIWAGSVFVRDTLSMYTSAPVVVVPVPIRLDVPNRVERRDFGLADDDVVFLYDFDGNSTAARKNPFGLVEAFARAFSGNAGTRPRPRLVLKGANLHGHREVRSELREVLRPLDGVLLDGELTRGEMNALLAACDVYVSLHRAEGFGLGKAEAMYLGKPVVTTAYPTVFQFPTLGALCPVRARLRAITEADHAYLPSGAAVYRPGMVWAEPDVRHAARWMTTLYGSPDLRRRIGAHAARLIREHHSPDAAARVMIERLRGGATTASGESVHDGAVAERLVTKG